MNHESISKALSCFISAIRPFVVNILEKYHAGEPWEGLFFKALPTDKQPGYNKHIREGKPPIQFVDYNNLVSWASCYRDDLIKEFGGDRSKSLKFYSDLKEARDCRNKVHHYTDLTNDERDGLFLAMKRMANAMNMPELYAEIERLKRLAEGREEPPAPKIPDDEPEQEEEPKQDDDQERLEFPEDEQASPAWFNNCVPQDDIRFGNLDESVFAADLNDVIIGQSSDVYQDPAMFFEKSYLTQGIRDLAGRVVRALNGEATENRIISLQTGFGGGKTHSLIAVYHLVKLGRRLMELSKCAGLLPKGVLPKFEGAKVAVFTNNTNDVVQGREVEEGLTLHTLWGEVAYQLGGREAYERVRGNDEQRLAPTTSILKPILEAAAPSLILIDELADYCNKASGVAVGSGSLFNQTVSFVQALTEAVSGVPRCVLMVTLPASSTEVSESKIGAEILQTLAARLARKGAHVKPVDDDEVFEVVRRRLFEKVGDPALIKNVAGRYRNLYQKNKTDVPDYACKAEYVEKIEKAYPFHPELIDLFRNRWGRDSRFQRTRGVLQILGSIVKDLWGRRASLYGPQMLILSSNVELANNPAITGKITNLMGLNWESVMAADVYGTSSVAYRLDDNEAERSIGKYRLVESVATTILLASVGGVRGFGMAQLKLCLLRPGAFRHHVVNDALDKLKGRAGYLHSSSGANPEYWFDAKPNLGAIIAKAQNEVKPEEVDSKVLELLNKGVQGSGMNVLVNPTADIPERRSLTMVALHPKFSCDAGGLQEAAKNEIKQISLKRGNSDRVYRNTIFFLVAYESELKELSNKVREVLAAGKVLDEYKGRLDGDQLREVGAKQREAEKDLEPALVRAYSLVVKYRAKGVEAEAWKTCRVMGFKRSFAEHLRSSVPSALDGEELLLGRLGRSLLIDCGLFPKPEKPVSVKELYEAFLRFDDKPMITGGQAVADTVNTYCERGAFNVAFGAPGNFTQIYERRNVPGLDVASEDYWLVDKAVTMPKPEPSPNPNGEDDTPQPPPQPEPPFGPKRYSKIKVSGSVPFENWADLYRSFLVPLRENSLRLKVEFTAFSTQANELTENSPTLASVKESARQLGLIFEAEE